MFAFCSPSSCYIYFYFFFVSWLLLLLSRIFPPPPSPFCCKCIYEKALCHTPAQPVNFVLDDFLTHAHFLVAIVVHFFVYLFHFLLFKERRIERERKIHLFFFVFSPCTTFFCWYFRPNIVLIKYFFCGTICILVENPKKMNKTANPTHWARGKSNTRARGVNSSQYIKSCNFHNFISKILQRQTDSLEWVNNCENVTTNLKEEQQKKPTEMKKVQRKQIV